MDENTLRHLKVKQGDEFYCNRCKLRWGLDDDEPACVPTTSQGTIKIGDTPLLNFAPSKLVIDPIPQRVKKAPEHIALIGFLTVALAVHDPDSSILKSAYEYLERNK